MVLVLDETIDAGDRHARSVDFGQHESAQHGLVEGAADSSHQELEQLFPLTLPFLTLASNFMYMFFDSTSFFALEWCRLSLR